VNGKLDVSGGLTVTGMGTTTNTLLVTGGATVNGTLDVSGLTVGGTSLGIPTFKFINATITVPALAVGAAFNDPFESISDISNLLLRVITRTNSNTFITMTINSDNVSSGITIVKQGIQIYDDLQPLTAPFDKTLYFNSSTYVDSIDNSSVASSGFISNVSQHGSLFDSSSKVIAGVISVRNFSGGSTIAFNVKVRICIISGLNSSISTNT